MIDLELLNKNMTTLGLTLEEDISGRNIGTKDKMKFKDKDGYLYSLSSGNISCNIRRNGTLSAFFNFNPYTYENINNYFKVNKINSILITINPKNAVCDLEWLCLDHNKIFNRSWNAVKNGITGCKECALEKYRNKKCLNIEYVKKESLKRYNISIISNKYINNTIPLDFICNKHKDKGIQSKAWTTIISNKHPCIYCSKEDTILLIRKSNEQFIKEVKNVHGDKYILLSKYVSCKEKVKVYCTKCNSIFEIQPNHLLEGHGCGVCTKSIGEQKTKDILDKNNINYIREYRYDDCIGINRKLPFDFYLPEYELCIEYQGIQHYKPVEIFGGIESFNKQKINDNIKRQYCKENNIKLLEIPYWEKDIEKLIINKINDIKEEL